MAYDPTCASIIVGNKRYQVLKPVETISVVVDQVNTGLLDDQGNPIIRDVLEQQTLPREWDEAATMALVYIDHQPAQPSVAPVVLEDVGE